ncbi:MAG: hypothetical protein RKE49_02065 [Oceanicaulis sp.]
MNALFLIAIGVGAFPISILLVWLCALLSWGAARRRPVWQSLIVLIASPVLIYAASGGYGIAAMLFLELLGEIGVYQEDCCGGDYIALGAIIAYPFAALLALVWAPGFAWNIARGWWERRETRAFKPD